MDDHEVIELNLTQDELCMFALLAHDADMKLNDWFMMVLKDHMSEKDRHELTEAETQEILKGE